MFFLRVTELTDFSWQSSWWWKLFKLSFPATQWIICRWISRDERLQVQWNEGQTMKVIDLKKQQKNTRFYSLASFTKPDEKPWKRKHSSYCFVSNISWIEDETKSPLILICNEKKNQIFYMLLQCKLDNESNLQRKQIFVIFNDCKDMLQNVDEIISRPLLAIFYRYTLLTALFFIFQFWGRIQWFYLGSKIIFGLSCSDGGYLAFFFYHLSSLWSQMIELVCLYKQEI